MKMTSKILKKNQCVLWVNGPRWTQLQLDLRKKCQYETPYSRGLYETPYLNQDKNYIKR